MNPKYSILFVNYDYEQYAEQINQWLSLGIKVIWFGNTDEVVQLKNTYPSFAKAFLLQTYIVTFKEQCIIIDGQDTGDFLTLIEKECPAFNVAQFRVEHCAENEHIVVQASAGTGKTKVMIDRIMYLMHTVDDLKMSDISMITFTNDAANQMNGRLQEILMERFHLTGNMKYFRWVEEQSQMNISTIHKFAHSMLKEFGLNQSFTRNLTIRDFIYERKELIKDVLDQKINNTSSIRSQIGLSFYNAKFLIDKYWDKFATLGISHSQLESMNWGNPIDAYSENFQNLVTTLVEALDEEFFDIKRRNDAIGVNDIMRDLQEVLVSEDVPNPDISMKYLFIDEFQDSDLSQITVATQLVNLLHAKLFVVGDVKQSIYSFRGASDVAFDILYKNLSDIGEKKPKDFILVNNYRTASNIMNKMNLYFEHWGRDGLLRYDGPVLPFNKNQGKFVVLDGYKNKAQNEEFIAELAMVRLEDLIDEIEKSGKKASEKDRVCMLVRTNSELKTITQILRKYRIPTSISTEGTFYTSEAVRDFYALICSYMFADEPKHIFNFLLTPYAGEIESIDVNLMEQFGGDYDKLIEYLGHFLKQTSWERYYKEFRLRPMMSVIKNIMDYEPILDNYIAMKKQRYIDFGWEERRITVATRRDAVQYQANLEKLMEILQKNLGGEKVSLYDIYHFLQLQIATNRQESEPRVGMSDDYKSILCMTVHKSKGLEFDTVILPFTNRRFPSKYNTEILIDPNTMEVGWNYIANKNNREMQNDLYVKLKEAEIQKAHEEETRILYVAMTRAINSLICIAKPSSHTDCWAYLLQEVDADE